MEQKKRKRKRKKAKKIRTKKLTLKQGPSTATNNFGHAL